jgi:hypothetical protein
MIPSFAPGGNLPPGIHWATWEEVVDRFGWTVHRQQLLVGLRMALDDLKGIGCRTVYVDGSFVTEKTDPGDFDACWERGNVDLDRVPPSLIAYDAFRRGMKERYGGEIFTADTPADIYGTPFLEFFQMDRLTDEPKGIVANDLGSEP